VLPQSSGVDALLTGQIVGLTITPASFTDQQQAARYTVTIVAKMEFRDLKTNQVLWDNPALVYREEYEAAQGTDALDPNAFFGQEANALERISTEFARSVELDPRSFLIAAAAGRSTRRRPRGRAGLRGHPDPRRSAQAAPDRAARSALRPHRRG
jgi:hypothetical protein